MLFRSTASSLIKVDLNGKVIGGTARDLNPAGFVIHSAVHMACHDLVCVMHTHTRANNAVAMQKNGLLPLSQKALLLWSFLRYHDFEGPALRLDEREHIVRDLGDGRVVILRNHGALTVGESVAEAFCWMYRLEAACLPTAWLTAYRMLFTRGGLKAGDTAADDEHLLRPRRRGEAVAAPFEFATGTGVDEAGYPIVTVAPAPAHLVAG